MMLAQPYYGSFPLSGTVRYSTVRYAIIYVSTQKLEGYQNSEPYHSFGTFPLGYLARVLKGRS